MPPLPILNLDALSEICPEDEQGLIELVASDIDPRMHNLLTALLHERQGLHHPDVMCQGCDELDALVYGNAIRIRVLPYH